MFRLRPSVSNFSDEDCPQPFKWNAKFKTLLMVFVCSVALASCGSGTNPSSFRALPAPDLNNTQPFDSSVVKGPLQDAIVSAIDANGNQAITSFTAIESSFDLAVAVDAVYPVVVQTEGGTDSITGQDVSTISLILKGALFSADQTSVNVNPFSTLMIEIAQAQNNLGESSINAILTSVQAYSFGLPEGFNPVSSQQTPTNMPRVLLAYETFFEVIRRVSNIRNQTPNTVLASIAADLSDGVVDGVGSANVDEVTSALFHSISGSVLLESLSGELVLDQGGATQKTLSSADLNAATELVTGETGETSTATIAPSSRVLAQTTSALVIANAGIEDPAELAGLASAVALIEAVPASDRVSNDSVQIVKTALISSTTALESVAEQNLDVAVAAMTNSAAAKQAEAASANSFPVPVGDAVSVESGVLAKIDVLANDPPAVDGFDSIVILQNPENGSVIVNSDNTIGYRSNAGFFGIDSVIYAIRDSDGDRGAASITVSVNLTPEAVPDAVATIGETPVQVAALANDLNLSDGPLSLSVTASPGSGVATVSGDAITYTAQAGFSGVDSFVYQIEDGSGDRSSATISVAIGEANSTNPVPLAVADSYTIEADTSSTLSPLENDLPLEDGPIALSVTQPANGMIEVVNLELVYTPDTGFGGADSFEYTVTDQNGDSDTVTVQVYVDASPQAAPRSIVLVEGESITFDLTESATGTANTPISVLIVESPFNGTLTSDGSILTYTALMAVGGDDEFRYSLTDVDGDSSIATVTIFTNAEPVAVADEVITDVGVTIESINVLANDTGLGNVPLTVSVDNEAAIGGVATLNTNGLVIFTPAEGFAGAASFSYTVTDLDGETSTAIVSIYVNDLPVAADRNVEVGLGVASVVDLLAESAGIGNPPISAEITSDPANGSLVLEGSSVAYTPTAGFAGDDAFSYRLIDVDGDTSASATISILVNDVPIAGADLGLESPVGVSLGVDVLENDSGLGNTPLVLSLVEGSSVGGNAVVVSGTSILFEPAVGFAGLAGFSYLITDSDGEASQAAVEIYFEDIPMAIADSIETPIDTVVTIDVLANDIGLSNAPILLQVTDPMKGTVTIGSNNQLVYSPALGVAGADALEYTITDADGDQSSAVVGVFIEDTPVAVNDSVTTLASESIIVDVLANDTGLANAPVTVSIATDVLNGSTSLSDNVLTYTPTTGFGGADSLTYTVTDEDGDVSSATVTILVDDKPSLTNQSIVTPLNQPIDIALDLNASGLGNTPLDYQLISSPTNGVVLLEGAVIAYTPDNNFASSDSLTYKVTDAESDNDLATVSIYVNDTPVTQDEIGLGTTINTALSNIDVLANDDGLRNLPISLAIVSGTEIGGSAMVNDDQSITFTPTTVFASEASFDYVVSDGDGDSSVSTVEVYVNDTPVAVVDSEDTPVDTPTAIDVLSNDSGLGNAPILVMVISGPSSGTAIVDPTTNIVTYTPNAGTVNSDSFQYQTTDKDGESSVADVVVFVDDTPVAVADNLGKTPINTTVAAIAILANDTGLGNNSVSVITSSEVGGTTVVNVDNTVTFTPTTGFADNASFEYTVTDGNGDSSAATVSLFLNDTPVAQNDSVGTPIDTPVSIDVTQNDTGLLNGLAAIEIVTPPDALIGSAVVNGTMIDYTPVVTGVASTDMFTYRISDADGDLSVPATVTIGIGFSAQDDVVSVIENTSDALRILGGAARTISILTNDALGPPPSATIMSVDTTGTSGMVVISGNDILYTPPVGAFGGSDSFTYAITNTTLAQSSTGTVSVKTVSICTLDNVNCAGLSPALEFTDIQSAVDAASPGDWVKIQGGTYNHATTDILLPRTLLDIGVSGTNMEPIRVEAFDGESVTLTGWRKTANGWGDCTSIDRSKNIQITGFDVSTSYIISIDGTSISEVGDTDSTTTVAKLAVALEASNEPGFVALAFKSSGDTLMISSPTGPFTVTRTVSGGTGTWGAVVDEAVTSPLGCTDSPVVNNEIVVRVSGEYIELRNVTIEDSTRYGLEVTGKNSTFENISVRNSFNDNIFVGARTLTGASHGNKFKLIESYLSRHGAGMLVSSVNNGNPIRYDFLYDTVIEDSLFYLNGHQSDGKISPPVAGDSAGGGNSDGFVVTKSCEDDKFKAATLVLNSVTRETLCPDNRLSGSVVFNNADDGIDATWGDSVVSGNISFLNGPQGFKGYKSLRQSQVGIAYVGNIAVSEDVGFEIRQDKRGSFIHNLAAHNNDELKRGIQISPTNLARSEDYEVFNNLSAFNPSFDFLITGNPAVRPDIRNNWVEDSNLGDEFPSFGDPMIVDSTFDGESIDVNFPEGSSNEEKLAFIRDQSRQALSPKPGSPLIDAGKLVPGLHCTTADDSATPPAVTATCRHWLGLAPDIGPYEVK
jgi:hypothetical protein